MFGRTFARDDGSTTANKEMARKENRRRASCHSVALRSYLLMPMPEMAQSLLAGL